MFIHASTGNCSDKILDLKGKTDDSFINMEKDKYPFSGLIQHHRVNFVLLRNCVQSLYEGLNWTQFEYLYTFLH